MSATGDRAHGGASAGSLQRTPSQTIGPFFAIGLPWHDGPHVVPEGTAGAITVGGRVHDGHGEIVPDALIETWQADPSGRYDGTEGGFRGFARAPTDDEGRWEIRTVKPGSVEGQAPHLAVSVFMRGLLTRVTTRIYFGDEEAANAADRVLQAVEPERRATLVAQPDGTGAFTFDIHMQGERETVFLAV